MAVTLCYPVVDNYCMIPDYGNISDAARRFGIQFPEHVVSTPIYFGVVVPNNPNSVTIDAL